MSNFNMSSLSIGKDGNYRDSQGNIVAKKGQALSGSAWKYLAQKYGTAYANNVSKQTRSGATYSNGKWIPAQKRATAQTNNPGPDSLTGKAIKWFGDKTGLYHIGNTASDLAGTAGYFIPGVGSALSAADAVNDFKKGNYGEAAMDAVFAIPFLGNIGKVVKTGLRLGNMAKAANAVGKGMKVIHKVEKPAQWALNAKLAYDLPGIGKTMYDSYNQVANAKRQIKPYMQQIQQARQQGASENDLRRALGQDYDLINTLGSRDDSFTGNLGSMWDSMNQD